MGLREGIVEAGFLGEVLTDEATLSKFSHDASIFEIAPELVVFPKNTADIETLVSYVSKEKKTNPNLSITARSAGTDMSGGPINTSIIVDVTKHLNRLIELNSDTKTAVVEPGLYYRDFEPETLAKNLIFPSYPASKSIAALGGIIANNAAGEKSLKYGKTNKFVKELEVVLADGKAYTIKPLTKAELEHKISGTGFEAKIYKQLYKLLEQNYDAIQAARPNVIKNSAGYSLWDVWNKQIFDLTQLLVGSQGTLGIITKAKVGLVDLHAYNRMGVLFLDSFNQLPNVAKACLALNPGSIEAFDDETLKLALRFLPEIAKRTNRSLFSLGREFLPELLAHGRLTKLPKIIVLIEFTEADLTEMERKITAFQQTISQNRWRALVLPPGKEQKYWTVRRESFNLLREHNKQLHAAPFIDDISVPIEVMPQFLTEMMIILNSHQIRVTLAGHVGEGNFHIIPLINFQDETQLAKIPIICDQVYALVIQYGGSTTGEHNDGLIRSRYLPLMYGQQIYSLFEKTKQIFDPLNIFNPGKKVGWKPTFDMNDVRRQW